MLRMYSSSPIFLVHLVSLVHLVGLVQPNKRVKPNEQNNGLLTLADCFSVLLRGLSGHSSSIGKVVIYATWNARLVIPPNVLCGDRLGSGVVVGE